MKRHAIAVAAALTMLLSAVPAQASWSPQSSGTTNAVRDVECPTAQRCYAVVIGGQILVTKDGGATWATRSSGTTGGLWSLSCPTETTCMASGDLGVIVKTTDGGDTWSIRRSGGLHLMDVDCPTASNCWTVGHGGTISATTDGGNTWSTQSSGTSENLFGVACPTTLSCFAVGHNGTILVKGGNSSSWARQSSGVTERLDGISCPTATTCTVSGEGGELLRTDSAGAVWTRQTTPFGVYYFDVDCPSASTCWAVGSAGVVVGTVNAGVTWEPEDTTTGLTLTGVGCAGVSVCKASGDQGTLLTRGGQATGRSSSDCEAVAGNTTVLDGFAGDAYVRVRTARPSPDKTWVCFRVDNGTSIKQGGLIEVDTNVGAQAPSTDGDNEACSTSSPNYLPGPHPLVDLAIGDETQPTYLPIKVDTFRHNEAAWACVRAGGQRVRVKVPLPDAQIPSVTYFPDAAGATPPPDDPPATQSGTCQASGGDRVLNMDVATTHVWLYTLRPALNEANVCVRAQGPVSVGGVLSVKAQVGLPVRISGSNDTTPCTFELFRSEAPVQLRIARTPDGVKPASVCVDQGTTHQRVTVVTDDPLVLPIPQWTFDQG